MIDREKMWPILTKNLEIRLLEEGDLARFVEIENNPDVHRYRPHRERHTIEDAREKLSTLRFSGMVYPVILLSESRYIGRCVFKLAASKTWEIGAFIDPEYQRRGFAREACSRLIACAFEDGGADRIEAKIDSENTASINLFMSLQFEFDSEVLCSIDSTTYTEVTYVLQKGPSLANVSSS